ncbi:Putative diheme cytochrome c-553 [Candidatus Paraburkholderia kirkii UZHbot1]|uniref:Putative diheme cytochrome c-553 n=1 Tax=Candidatus Paraburkholderia kirkii UZHbot1 TaxID=1055526 RepID=G4MAJ5_9BURK|nr:Putative diheme cytochrome c-553 [Candidatus Paraburkholderia kirkii UZHbot1]
MKRKSLFALSSAVVVAAVAAGAVLWSGGDNLHSGGDNAATPADNATLIKQGEYLARAGDCIACHTVRGGKQFAGGLPMATPFGTMFTPNITPDDQYGIGKWTSDDFYRAMHTGRSKDGSLLYPGFPFTSYTKVTRANSDAIYAYLRSVPPVNEPSRPHELRFPFNNRNLLIGWRTLFFSEGEYKPDPTKSVEWNRGAYLVEGLGHCGMCHTSINAMGGPVSSAAFAGGLIPLQNWYAPSLTSNKEAGLGDWDLKDINDLLKTGVSQRGAVFGPMAEVVHNSLQYMTDADVNAISTYFKSIPQKKEAPEVMQLGTSEKFGGELLTLGKKVYTENCAKCHAENGLGKPPAYPPLANNQSIQMQSAVNPIRMTLNGGYPPSTEGNPMPHGMMPFAQALSDTEVAAVVTYIRMSWGNHGTPVSPQQVSNLRSAPLD